MQGELVVPGMSLPYHTTSYYFTSAQLANGFSVFIDPVGRTVTSPTSRSILPR
jgi:hypothetical protein